MTQSFPYPELCSAGVLFSTFVIVNWRLGSARDKKESLMNSQMEVLCSKKNKIEIEREVYLHTERGSKSKWTSAEKRGY
jgi:hypothetical protein